MTGRACSNSPTEAAWIHKRKEEGGKLLHLLLQLFEHVFSYPEKSPEFGVQGAEEFCCSQKHGGEQGVERET